MRVFLCVVVVGGFLSAARGEESPVYESDFSKKTALDAFDCTDKAAWRVVSSDGRPTLELFQKSKYKYEVRSPFNIALLATHTFGSFVLEAELLQTGKEYGHRDMCLFFNFQDRSHFYYVHIASVADDHANQIFIVDGKPRTKISTKTNKGNDWGQKEWHKIRLVRDVKKGTIQLFFDDMKTPVMEASDTTFGQGYVGFGSFDDTGMVSNVKIFSKTAKKVEATGMLFK